ncbi:sodium:solute symporter family protein [Pseudonocardia xinjiangensis]|uniref:Sodium:solute symporter family protein n=1 Tax=Pseudonocardia xinjiangensis TaxID=75289 RepID=A0ABX1RBK7_9PSEU|nr:sodium:solute symporter family protein [Pseudonocardia xinjiangensis]NMH77289.1 sodium:solute symporter family protein [Pseudonocardia xinjiangensis]
MVLALVLVIVLGTAVGSIVFGRWGGSTSTLTGWAVGGRQFGSLMFWFMNAGEIYTIFALLGISGYAWSMGAPAYLALTSVSLSYAVGYWLMPKIWRAGRRHGLITEPDFFAARYDAPWLGVVTGVVGIAALVVYVQIQLVSLELIVRMTLGAAVAPGVAAVLGAVLMLAFVLVVGMRSAVFAAAVKDVLVVVVVVALSATVAERVGASSLFDVFRLVEEQHPGIGRFPGLDPTAPTTSVWLMTSALNVALGNWVFPHLFQVSFTARSGTAIRRTAIWQPLYSLAYFFVILLGFGALLAGVQPGDAGSNGALLQFVSTSYPSWLVGLFAGTAFLLALAPGAVLLLTTGSIFTRNVLIPLRPGLSDRTSLLASRLSMIVFAAAAVFLTVGSSESLVDILLYSYSAIGMLAPGVFLAFLWRRTSAVAVLLGIAAGFVALLAPFAKHFWAATLPEWEPGLIAMAINAVVVVLVSVVTSAPDPAAVAVGVESPSTRRPRPLAAVTEGGR